MWDWCINSDYLIKVVNTKSKEIGIQFPNEVRGSKKKIELILLFPILSGSIQAI